MAHRVPKTWRRDSDKIYITIDPSSIPFHQINSIFAEPDFTWGKPLNETQFQTLLATSLCFAVFKAPQPEKPSPQLIGLGRWITDDVTVVYVNDIYILKEYRGRGLAKWMLQCMNEQLDLMPALRGTILIVEKNSTAENLYRRHFGMENLADDSVLLDRKGPGSTMEEMLMT